MKIKAPLKGTGCCESKDRWSNATGDCYPRVDPHPAQRIMVWMCRRFGQLFNEKVLGILTSCRVGFIFMVLSMAAAAGFSSNARVAMAQEASAEQQLADTYSPIAMLKQQEGPCDRNGEPYVPAPVEIVLGDAQVLLREDAGGDHNDDPTLVDGPTAQDLAAAGELSYIDFPGNPRKPGCDYARFAQTRMAELTPTTYAHVVVDTATGKVALQYWFYYVFNDFNNTHESDWEMIQIVFQAGSIEEALQVEPIQVGYAQHGGGELAAWDDVKLQREGSHPVVYPAAGSHATYYGDKIYIGWGEHGTGFGCDDTTAPSNRVPLEPVLVPTDPDPNGPFAWLLFEGRWGERQPWEFNGPKGPNLGGKWNDPIGSIENWRSSSLIAPGSQTLGPSATDFFCTVSERGSSLLIYAGVYPWLVIGGVSTAITLLMLLFIVARRTLSNAVFLYVAYWRAFLGIGLLTVPIGIAFNGMQLFVAENPPMDWVLQWFNDTASAKLTVVALVGGAQQLAMILIVAPAIIQAISDIRSGLEPGVVRSYRYGLRRFEVLVVAVLILVIAVFGLLLLIVGLPLALFLAVRWQFFGQAVVLDHVTEPRAALRRSSQVVRGKWWRALAASFVFQLLGALPGPLVGIALLIGGGTTVQLANAVSSLVFAIAIPISVIALTLVYEQLSGRAPTRPALSIAESPPEPGAIRA